MLAKALPLFALIVCFGMMVMAPMRRYLLRVAVEAGLLVMVWLPLHWEGARLVPSTAHPDEPWLQALAVVWWMVAARLIVTLMSRLTVGTPRRQERLFSDLIKAAIYVAAVLFVLNFVLQFPIEGLLATSGVVAVVLGLALQNTLADVFAGIAVGVEQPFHVGDEVSVSDHAEGTVVQMNWRSVRIQQAGDLAIVPNSVVAKGQVVNRSRPTAQRFESVDITVPNSPMPEKIIELLDHALMLCGDISQDPSPGVNLDRLGVRYMTFKVGFFVASTALLQSTRSLVLRQCSRQLRVAGIADGERPTASSLLGSLAIFDRLTEEQLAALASQSAVRRLGPGDLLFEEGSEGLSLFVVQAGVLDVLRASATGERHGLGRIGAGEYVGEVSLLSGHPHQVTATALTSCEVLELPRSAIVEIVRSDPGLMDLLKESVQRGLSTLSRDDAARLAHQPIEKHQLLRRLRELIGPASGG